MARVGFIGTGVIAAAMVRGIAADDHQIVVSERNAKVASELVAELTNVSIASNQAVLDDSDVVILCLMDDVARAVLPTLKFHSGQVVYSAMARFSNDELVALCAPATAGGTVIPFGFIARGNSPLLTLPVDAEGQAGLERLFGNRNSLFELDGVETFNKMMAIQALVLPSLTRVVNSVKWAQEQGVDSVLAEGFLRQLIGGFLLSEPLDQAHAAEMAASLGTPGGLNATLDQIMTDGGDEARLREGYDQLRASLGS